MAVDLADFAKSLWTLGERLEMLEMRVMQLEVALLNKEREDRQIPRPGKVDISRVSENDFSDILTEIIDIVEANDFRKVYAGVGGVAQKIYQRSGGVNERTGEILQVVMNRLLSKYYEDPTAVEHLGESFHINVNFLDDVIMTEMWLGNFLDFIYKKRFVERYSSMKPVMEYIDHHIRDYINMSTITEQCHLSQQYMLRLFKDRMKMSALEYIQCRKMMLAKWYLYFEEYATPDVAAKIGYVDAGYFSKVFKKYTGMTPYQYKQEVRGRSAASKRNGETK